MRLGNERRFSDVYSAAGQRERRGNGWADEDFFLHLRIDALLAHTIVVPDTYVLDGAYLTGTSPQELLDGLGRGVARRELPLEVRARRSSLSESLRQFLVRSDSDALNPFPFNAIESAPARHALAATLGTRTSDDLDAAIRREGSVVGGMIGLLRHGLADAGHEAEEDLNRSEAERKAQQREADVKAPQHDLVDPDDRSMLRGVNQESRHHKERADDD